MNNDKVDVLIKKNYCRIKSNGTFIHKKTGIVSKVEFLPNKQQTKVYFDDQRFLVFGGNLVLYFPINYKQTISYEDSRLIQVHVHSQ